MAIDGNVYILHDDGTIYKYLTGELQSFDTSGVPEGFSQPVSLAVDADGDSGRVYVADTGNKRVVVLEPDGTFCAQFHTEEAFDELEALAVDETTGRFYVFSGGRLYVAPLPLLP
jgi:DNA-binding beta-propeller fold protein YncE